MTAGVAPSRASAPDPATQMLLMRLTGALNRRRAYAATHPMVIAAEHQLHESLTAALAIKPVLTIGVARHELLIDGETYVTKSSYARELATRLHRRGVGAVTFQVGVPLLQLRETLAWLAHEQSGVSNGGAPSGTDLPPVLSGASITLVAYDQLTLGDVERAADESGQQLWNTLAQLAGDPHPGSAVDASGVATRLRESLNNPDVARKTAIAFMELAAQGANAPQAGRERIGEQLNRAIESLGESTFGPVIRSLGERSLQQRFVSQVVDVLPVATVASWLNVAAQAQDQQISHHMLRLMSKLSNYAETQQTTTAENVFRGAAQDLVKGWSLEDPNPEEHVALLDRIALHERTRSDTDAGTSPVKTAIVESSRLVQMALEIDVGGEDADAAADALLAAGSGAELIQWTDAVGATRTARRVRDIATSEKAIRQLLLNEPVDRLQARALLEQLDASSAETLLDVLEVAEARGTRMIVRQRLSEFGGVITPNLSARLDDAPWYLVRNVLTLLHDIAESQGGAAAGLDSMTGLLDHPQVQVRTEAFRLLLLNVRTRDTAIQRALHDDNERLVVLALQALSESPDPTAPLPAATVTGLMAKVDAGRHSESVRARMVRALAHTGGDTVREWLISHVARRSRILRRMTLVEPTLTAVAALHVLQRLHATDPDAADVIALARRNTEDRRWHARDTGMEHIT